MAVSFAKKPDAFQFANPPQGTFTGAAVADYDRDGWLDIYFCLYAYYQGTGQYKYPSPYHDAENGPPNFLMRNHRDGTFRDVTAAAGLNQNNTRYSFCCGWNDYNRDGWPDLYVVNDFGRKNLYRNNGDGTFTDVAAEAGVEDVGAGMSVSWLDYDNDGRRRSLRRQYVDCGRRASLDAGQSSRRHSSTEVRALYQKHAMGNSLLHNRGSGLSTTRRIPPVPEWAAGHGRATRWISITTAFRISTSPTAWSPASSRQDLNSFFWRQVVASSPDDARALPRIRAGMERDQRTHPFRRHLERLRAQCLLRKQRDGTFSDVSGVVGLDFVEDGRSFALADFDHDGRLEVFLKNRNAPQLRLLKNVAEDLPPSIAFRLQGTKSNRDAIGASDRRSRPDQDGKRACFRPDPVFFRSTAKISSSGLERRKVRYEHRFAGPAACVQDLHNLPINHRIWVEEGSEPSRMEPFRTVTNQNLVPAGANSIQVAEKLPSNVETWLLSPIAAPDFSLRDQSGNVRTLSALAASQRC